MDDNNPVRDLVDIAIYLFSLMIDTHAYKTGCMV